MELPKWKCHKTVQAAKITGFDIDNEGEYTLTLEGIEKPVIVSDDYMHKHKPEIGGYYIVYADGYESFSPAEAFEGGYTKIME
jgi:hypothetical protein